MHIAIGSDHRGLVMKGFIKRILTESGYAAEDLGCFTENPVDYPDIALKVAEAIVAGEYQYGILICGTGIGMSIAANKVKGIRAANCNDAFSARRARQHNNANILCIAAEGGKARIPSIVETFLTGEFENGRHQHRLDKISAIEKL